MAKVVLPQSFLALTGGEREFVTGARNYRDLLAEMRERWPELDERLDKSAVAIDGQIYQDAFLEPIGEDSEVYFMARIEGG